MFGVYVVYKKYKECPGATLFSGLGAASIVVGIVFAPLLYLMTKDIGWMRWESIAVLVALLAFIILGACSMWYAPRHARKVLAKRIGADLEYGRYIASKYPQYVPLVKSLQPQYDENDPRPITDFYKQEQKVPLWRLLLCIGLLAALFVFLQFLRKQ